MVRKKVTEINEGRNKSYAVQAEWVVPLMWFSKLTKKNEAVEQQNTVFNVLILSTRGFCQQSMLVLLRFFVNPSLNEVVD